MEISIIYVLSVICNLAKMQLVINQNLTSSHCLLRSNHDLSLVPSKHCPGQELRAKSVSVSYNGREVS